MIIYAIDPGHEISALVVYDSEKKRVLDHLTEANLNVLHRLEAISDQRNDCGGYILVIEQFESFGMAVGREVFSTVWWSGRFYQAWDGNACMVPRRAVKLHLCGTSRANDSNVRTAIIDYFGGKIRAVGQKLTPGPLYGIKGHEFSALALALTEAGQAGV